jgi:hypothetical protein
MATVVLRDLIYNICEMTASSLLPTIIFKRFKDKNIYLKASKCKFGLPKVEYVGRTISKEGISMSAKNINSVLDFPKPTVNTQLRSFLGL